jgi:hypothetical protein
LCVPNCQILFGDLINIRVIVIRGIEMGEEMTITYLPLDWESDGPSPAHDRQKALKEAWGFDCMCKLS